VISGYRMQDLVRVTGTSGFTVPGAEKKSRIANPDTGYHFWNATKIVFKSLTYKNVLRYIILNYPFTCIQFSDYFPHEIS
jgi:hypothetical protein